LTRLHLLTDALRRAGIAARGSLRHWRPLAEIHGVWLLAKGSWRLVPAEARVEAFLLAARRLTSRPLRGWLQRRIRPWLSKGAAERAREHRIGMRQYEGSFGGFDDAPVTFTRVLKAPGPNGEKGVLYSAFEYNWVRLLHRADARGLLAEYDLVGASSWSPPDYALFLYAAGLSDDPLLMGISNLADVEAYRLIAPVIEPLPLMACDWIDPRHYTPRSPDVRSIDILMVANWLPFKRHWLLFEALRTMRRDLRVVLVGRNAPGRTAETIRVEARAFGVRQELELLTDISIDEVTRLQCDSRISCLFSRREGSCVAVVESFFADTPVAMMADAHVGSKAYINDATGMLVKRAGLGRQLSRLLETRDRYSPRAWAMDHVTYLHSSRRLNDVLRDLAMRKQRPWTTDIARVCWRPYPQYAEATDAARFAGAMQSLSERYGVVLEPSAWSGTLLEPAGAGRAGN
jgi:glycosyltransferase involved in cell wall biosynthesis